MRKQLIALLILLFGGCAPSEEVAQESALQKRKYMSGWHLSKKSGERRPGLDSSSVKSADDASKRREDPEPASSDGRKEPIGKQALEHQNPRDTTHQLGGERPEMPARADTAPQATPSSFFSKLLEKNQHLLASNFGEKGMVPTILDSLNPIPNKNPDVWKSSSNEAEEDEEQEESPDSCGIFGFALSILTPLLIIGSFFTGLPLLTIVAIFLPIPALILSLLGDSVWADLGIYISILELVIIVGILLANASTAALAIDPIPYIFLMALLVLGGIATIVLLIRYLIVNFIAS